MSLVFRARGSLYLFYSQQISVLGSEPKSDSTTTNIDTNSYVKAAISLLDLHNCTFIINSDKTQRSKRGLLFNIVLTECFIVYAFYRQQQQNTNYSKMNKRGLPVL